MHDLPGSLRLTSTFPFVGRSAELETLRALMPLARGRGPPGRPASAASPARARAAWCASSRPRRPASGALVLYGACDAVVRTPYGPFVEALDHLARVIDPAELRAALGTAGGELTRLLPDLPARVGDLPPPVEADPDTERHRLHTAVDRPARGVSRRGRCCSCSRTATGPTRRRSCSCATSRAPAGSARVLLLATFRDTEADVPETLSETLADLRRSDDVVRLRLDGPLGRRGRREFVRRAAGGDAGAGPPELAQAIGELTDGNAVPRLRAVARAGRDRRRRGRRRHDPAHPAARRARDARRACARSSASGSSRLAPGTTDLLELAATAGPEFELDILAPRRRPRASPSCSPRSTRPSAAG